MSDPNDARDMLAMAEKDLRALTGMTDENVFAENIFGFHAQQAVEKSLKAWIASFGIAYPFIHDLSRLLSILEEQGTDIDAFQDLVQYNIYAVQYRYDVFDASDDPLDRQAVIEEVQALYDHVSALLASREA